ncbi:hypothetical protein Leryth_018337, partial [Lithospermum erythrorhizon]
SFWLQDATGKDVDLSIYKGKVLLIVNVVLQFGLTNSNYTELAKLYEKYKNIGLEILAFPCNQFGSQEPGSNEEIQQLLAMSFAIPCDSMFQVDVNGSDAAPIYKFLKSSKGSLLGDGIKWNFAKFLVDKDGNVVDRYAPTTSPSRGLICQLGAEPTWRSVFSSEQTSSPACSLNFKFKVALWLEMYTFV